MPEYLEPDISVMCPHCKKYYSKNPFATCEKCGKPLVSWKIKGEVLGFGLLVIIVANWSRIFGT